jgi:DNA repair exonuclease SbcCD ATPase subunit
MEGLALSRTPEVIAAEINHIKEQTRRQVLYSVIEIGRKLTEAKELVPHGEWGNWLEVSVDYKKSTANNFMKIFEEYGADQLSLLGDNAKCQAFGELSYTQAIALLGIPSEDREEFIKENNVEDMSSRELKKAIEDLKKEKEAREEVEIKLKERETMAEKSKEIIEKLKKDAATKNSEAFRAKAEAKEYELKVKEYEKTSKDYEKKIKELEDRPIEVTGVAEPNKELEEEIERLKEEKQAELDKLNMEKQSELDKLNKEKEELEIKLKESEEVDVDDATIRYAIYFNALVDYFDKLIGSIGQIKLEEEREKYKNATKKFINVMLERL